MLLKWDVDSSGTKRIKVTDDDGTEVGTLKGIISSRVGIISNEDNATTIVADVGGIQSLLDAGIDLSKKII